MKKVIMMIGLISVLATSANAGYWSHTPYSDTNYMGGATQWYSTYNY